MATRPYHSTPPKPTPRGYNQYSSGPAPLAKARKQQLRKNMHGYFLGPMDPSEFMRSFMPINSPNLGSPPDGIDFHRVYDQVNERSMYPPFVAIANEVCTNYVAMFTGDRADAQASLKPDITFFSKNNPAYPREGSYTASTLTSFLHMELFVELKHDTQSDPFRDLSSGEMEERDSINGDDTRGQCLLYAANQLAYQHRLFAFSLVICGKIVRFVRWDREGVVASAGIDCSQHQDLVIEFLQRFNQLTADQRGLDPTATPATPEETRMFDRAAERVKIEYLRRTVGDGKIYPRFRLEVRNTDDSVSHYIVGRAMDYNLGVTGRCTRGFLALDLSTKECVFLKDMWRPDVPGLKPEHVWYERLASAKVPHLVRFKHASDVVPSTPSASYYGTAVLDPTETTSRDGGQRGLTSRLACLFPSRGTTSLQGHVHYRLVQNEICRQLSEFTNSRHLVLVVLDSLKACSSAFVDAGLFHRDVSFGNIMIGFDNEGRLNDWDLCRDVDVDKSLEGPRTGTWQFMSTRLLTNPGSKHTITDDLESHYFVLMWTALHWVKHSQPNNPGINMEYIFDHQQPLSDGIVSGGIGKAEMYWKKNRKLRGVEFACKPFDQLFWDLWKLFARYLTQRQEADQEEDLGPGEHPKQDLDTGETLNSDEDLEPSVSPQEVIGLFEAALRWPGWIDDKVEDQFPRAGSKNASGMALSDLDNGDNQCNPNQGKKRGPSKSLAVDLEQLPAKRPKGS